MSRVAATPRRRTRSTRAAVPTRRSEADMKIEARIFLVITLFCWLAAAAYGAWTDAIDGGIEMAGFVALILSGGLLGICGSFFWFISRRIDPRPEDRSDAEI